MEASCAPSAVAVVSAEGSMKTMLLSGGRLTAGAIKARAFEFYCSSAAPWPAGATPASAAGSVSVLPCVAVAAVLATFKCPCSSVGLR